MVTTLDSATRSIFQSQLRLKDDLVFVPQHFRGKLYYHVENKSTGQFYRIGLSEYLFVSQLDGETTFAEALQVSAQQSKQPLSQPDAVSLYQWLIRVGLGSVQDAPSRSAGEQVPATYDRRRWNPFWIKIPLLTPDALVANWYAKLKWVFSFPMVCAYALLIVAASLLLMVNFDRFMENSAAIFSPWNWLWLFVFWIGLKVAHELAHALVCKGYGGEVRECGIIMILLAPMAYVDVTSSWRFNSKWKRIHVAIAGVCFEILIAAVGVIGWCVSESPLATQLFFDLVVIASVSTLLFNMNPLMRFDGYYILSDMLEIPNLYSQACQFTRGLARWLFFGDSMTSGHEVGAPWWTIRIYGLLAAAWRITVTFGLLLVASTFFHGMGILLAAFALLSWYGRPVKNILIELAHRFHENRNSVIRAVAVSIGILAICTASYLWIPSPVMLTSPGIVEYADISSVRAAVPGFIAKIYVSDGQFVGPGAKLIEIRNELIEQEYSDLSRQIDQCQIRHKMTIDRHQTAETQIQQRKLIGLHERLSQVKKQVQGLTVYSPKAGKVVARQLQNRLGDYVTVGQELVNIGRENRKEIRLSVGQKAANLIDPRLGRSVPVRIGSRRKTWGTLDQLNPRASTDILDPALGSHVGGTIAVREKHQVDSDRQKQWEFAEPRFLATIKLSPTESLRLFAGETGYALIRWRPESLGIAVRECVSAWIRNKLDAATAGD